MIPFKKHSLPEVTDEDMNRVYEALKTPYKVGPVLKIDGCLTDSPSVFYYDGAWYMYYIKIDADCDSSGYDSHLARSRDLVHFKTVKKIFSRQEGQRWDSGQVAAYAALFDTKFGGKNEIGSIGGRYLISYLGGCGDGYEPDPLYIGLGYGESPIGEFTRLEEPILGPYDEDIREGEEKTLYRSFIFEDGERMTGYPYVLAYNGKNNDDRERIYLAVSEDGEHFTRYGERAVIDDLADCPTNRISGDAEIIKIEDLYVLVYFRIIDGGRGYDTFAVSRDLVSFRRWDGEPLIAPSEVWDDLHAHKPWIIKVDDTVYHYYCAVNTRGERFIALATSRDIGRRHILTLNDEPYSKIEAGKKTVEMRLYDKRRQAISVGDEIEFSRRSDGERLSVRVTGLRRFSDFGALYSAYPKEALGYEPNECADPTDMEAYYDKEKIAEYGVLAIEIERIEYE